MEYDPLKLENQLCFPLYAAAKGIVRSYRPYLDPLRLTYTQYIAMMVMWEHKELTVSSIGQYLMLDSGTLTPMLKKMESAGLVTRSRSKTDEREMIVRITPKGEALKTEAAKIPAQMASCLPISIDEAVQLKTLLSKLIQNLK